MGLWVFVLVSRWLHSDVVQVVREFRIGFALVFIGVVVVSPELCIGFVMVSHRVLVLHWFLSSVGLVSHWFCNGFV